MGVGWTIFFGISATAIFGFYIWLMWYLGSGGGAKTVGHVSLYVDLSKWKNGGYIKTAQIYVPFMAKHSVIHTLPNSNQKYILEKKSLIRKPERVFLDVNDYVEFPGTNKSLVINGKSVINAELVKQIVELRNEVISQQNKNAKNISDLESQKKSVEQIRKEALDSAADFNQRYFGGSGGGTYSK